MLVPTTRRRIRGPLVVAVAAAMVALLAACGSTTSSGSGASGSSKSSALTAYPTPNVAVMKAEAAKVLAPYMDVQHVAPEIQEALMVSARTLSPAQEKVYDTCVHSDVCETGTGKYTLAIVDDQINPYYVVARAEMTAYAIKTGEIKKIIHSSANDLQTWLSNFRTAITQGADMIVDVYGAFGAEAGPVIAQARAKGIAVVNGPVNLPPDVAKFLNVDVNNPLCSMWAAVAKPAAAADKAAGATSLEYAQFTGPPGNGYAATWQPCASTAFSAGGWTKVYSGNTNWTPQGTVTAAAALQASGKSPTAIQYDGDPSSWFQAFQRSGVKKMPAFYDIGTTYVSGAKAYIAAEKAGLHPQLYITPSQSWMNDISEQIELEIKDGKTPSGKQVTYPMQFVNFASVAPTADLNQPSLAVIGTAITPQEQSVALGQ